MLISGQDEALDFAPAMPRLAQKLARRCWPGPVTIAVEVGAEKGLLGQLPAASQDMVALGRTGTIPRTGARNRAGDPQADAGAAGDHGQVGADPLASAGESKAVRRRISLIVDDGACRYGGPSTLESVTDNRWKLINQGVVSETMLGRLSSETYLFVCTGNTCRSPMAEGYFRKMLPTRLRCHEDELSDRGYIVASAGLAAVERRPVPMPSTSWLARELT